jgi:8-oxo-dGTP diphosphatase
MVPVEKRFKVVPAVYIVFRDGEKVLLLRRFGTGYLDGSYSLPSGHIEGGERAIDAAIREGKEEVNADLTREELHFAHVLHRQSDLPSHHERIDLFFTTDKLHPEIRNMEPNKCDELRWVSLNELPDGMIPEVRHVLQAILRDELYSDYNFEI